MIKALIFDFDGLILDTELPVYRSWSELYVQLGVQLKFEDWANIIGRSEAEHFDPFSRIEEMVGSFDKEYYAERRYQRELELIYEQDILPGVAEYLDHAKARELLLGVASSSTTKWVIPHLERLGLRKYFQMVRCADDVSSAKPSPELYQLVLNDFSVNPHEAIAFEDSPNGARAAVDAGIPTVVVPNALTINLQFPDNVYKLHSLADVSLQTIIAKMDGKNA